MHGASLANLLLVGAGGFVGAVARYLLGGAVMHAAWSWRLPVGSFPAGTFTVNVGGCLLIGVLAGLAERHGMFGPQARLFLFTGLLGGFTTFSAFGLEATALLRRGEWWMAVLYAGASVVLGIGAVWLGMRLVALVSR